MGTKEVYLHLSVSWHKENEIDLTTSLPVPTYSVIVFCAGSGPYHLLFSCTEPWHWSLPECYLVGLLEADR